MKPESYSSEFLYKDLTNSILFHLFKDDQYYCFLEHGKFSENKSNFLINIVKISCTEFAPIYFTMK